MGAQKAEKVDMGEWESRARNLFEKKLFEASLKAFEKATKEEKLGVDAFLRAATCALKICAFQKANKFADLILKQKECAQALTIKGIASLELNQPERAVVFLERAISKDSNTKAAPHLLQRAKQLMRNSTSEIIEDKTKLRKWLRAPVPSTLCFRDHKSGANKEIKVLNLSAGGCLVEYQELPAEFVCTLKIKDQEIEIPGVAKRAYNVVNKGCGLRFIHINKETEAWLDEQVKAFRNQ